VRERSIAVFQYFWPEEVTCEKCQEAGEGSTFYVGEEPLFSVCTNCDPLARNGAVRFATNLAEEDLVNGWEWFELQNS